MRPHSTDPRPTSAGPTSARPAWSIASLLVAALLLIAGGGASPASARPVTAAPASALAAAPATSVAAAAPAAPSLSALTQTRAPSGPAAAKRPPQSIIKRAQWKACASAPGFECATVKVPVDYDQPTGATWPIALTRLKARVPSKRIGALFTNPGGPGGPGIPFIQGMGETLFTPEVRDRFDIIGFDPRGVGQSKQALCFSSAEEEAKATASLDISFPYTNKQAGPYARIMRDFGAACAKKAGAQVRHMSTANVARDMDVLRRSLGESEMNFAGYSYGTYLGATYSALYPHRVRTLMVDGTMDVAGWNTDAKPAMLGPRFKQDYGANLTMNQFYKECAKAGPSRCELAALGDPKTVNEASLKRLKAKPLEAVVNGQVVKLDYSAVVMEMYFGMYSPANWSDLSSLLALVARRDKVTLDVPPAEEGAYTSAGASLGPVCAEIKTPAPLSEFWPTAERRNKSYPHFALARNWVDASCSGMRNFDTDAYRGSWKQTTKAPVMVVGTTYDPATPNAFTKPYAQNYSRASVLTVNGFGHTGIGLSACYDTKVANYLITGKAQSGTCGQDVKPFPAAPTGSPKSERNERSVPREGLPIPGNPTVPQRPIIPGTPLTPGLLSKAAANQ